MVLLEPGCQAWGQDEGVMLGSFSGPTPATGVHWNSASQTLQHLQRPSSAVRAPAGLLPGAAPQFSPHLEGSWTQSPFSVPSGRLCLQAIPASCGLQLQFPGSDAILCITGFWSAVYDQGGALGTGPAGRCGAPGGGEYRGLASSHLKRRGRWGRPITTQYLHLCGQFLPSPTCHPETGICVPILSSAVYSLVYKCFQVFYFGSLI